MIALIGFVLAVLASPFKSKSRLEAENAVLRHQLIVLRRKLKGRARVTNNDRWFFVQMYRCFPSPVICGNIVRTTGVSVMSVMVSNEAKPRHTFDSAEMGAIAHLYRGEVYRSTIWRTRLDNTTNWSIVTMGIALSTTFSSPEASPLPLLLVGLLIAVFLGMEARRYRYFNVWRARARWLERNFYAPIFTGEAHDDSWRAILASDYTAPRHHISFVRAAGRRLRRNYVWIVGIQALASYGKKANHPTSAATWAEFSDRATLGPIPGWIVLMIGFAYNFGWLAFALGTMWLDQREHGAKGHAAAIGW